MVIRYEERNCARCPYQILVQLEMMELIEGFLLVLPAHVYSSSLRNFQHPTVVRSRAALQVEVRALRQQLRVMKRSQRRRVRLNSADRVLLGRAFPLLVTMALRAAYREARNGDLLGCNCRGRDDHR
jgi:hypothetical protein